MNPGVLKLCCGKVRPSPDLLSETLQIEDNIGESIHIHLRNLRLDFTVRDFLALEGTFHRALLRLLERIGLNGRLLDKSFLCNVAYLVPKMVRIQEQKVRLGDLRIVFGTENPYRRWRFKPIPESAVFRALQGEEVFYQDYMNRFGATRHTLENLRDLEKNIADKGYPAVGWIVTFGDEPCIRDGQHRAAILYRLYGGDLEIPVLNVQFAPSFQGWRMVDPKDSFGRLAVRRYGSEGIRYVYRVFTRRIGLRTAFRRFFKEMALMCESFR